MLTKKIKSDNINELSHNSLKKLNCTGTDGH